MRMRMWMINQRGTLREMSLPMGMGMRLQTLPRRPGALSAVSRCALLNGACRACACQALWQQGALLQQGGPAHGVDAGPGARCMQAAIGEHYCKQGDLQLCCCAGQHDAGSLQATRDWSCLSTGCLEACQAQCSA